MVFINKAIGQGRVFRREGAVNGAHESYVTKGVGYPEELLMQLTTTRGTIIGGVSVADLLGRWLGKKIVLKIDIEGNEHAIFEDPLSMQMMAHVDYFAIEVHPFAMSDNLKDSVREQAIKFMGSFENTHDCTWVPADSIFYARKKH
jgi:hypothetical protein